MQYPFSCVPHTYAEIETTVSVPRINRYIAEAKGDRNRALRLYVWNNAICEAFYLPNQLLEVAIRNRLHLVLTAKFGESWHTNRSFLSPLPDRFQKSIAQTYRDCRKDHGADTTVDHVVSALTLGFWSHLLTQNFEHVLWLNGMVRAFPYIPPRTSRQTVYDKVDTFRNWRNRIAHHGAVFDKRPTKELRNIEEIMSWICPGTLWFMRQINSVERTISRKPTC